MTRIHYERFCLENSFKNTNFLYATLENSYSISKKMVTLEDQKQFWFSITKPTNREARLVRKKVINKYSSLVWLIRLSDPLQPTVPLVCTIKQGSSEIKLAHIANEKNEIAEIATYLTISKSKGIKLKNWEIKLIHVTTANIVEPGKILVHLLSYYYNDYILSIWYICTYSMHSMHFCTF